MCEQRRKTVLVADDEPSVRRLVSRMLVDYDVIEAENGREAVDMARIHRPDVIFMDMMMPEVDGLSACCEIKADEGTSDIPVVMLTGISYDLNKKFSEDVFGANGYVTKPFTRESLLQELERLALLPEADNRGRFDTGDLR
jgi:two-component system, OmpR family, alkaline phosphatase synthesis response regulator PhoP